MKKKSLDTLKGQKEALQERLKAVQEEIRRKEAAKAAREASQARKNRTHALILLGTLFEALLLYRKIPADQTLDAAKTYYGNQINQAQNQTPKQNHTPEEHAKRIQRKVQKLERDRNLLINTLKILSVAVPLPPSARP